MMLTVKDFINKFVDDVNEYYKIYEFNNEYDLRTCRLGYYSILEIIKQFSIHRIGKMYCFRSGEANKEYKPDRNDKILNFNKSQIRYELNNVITILADIINHGNNDEVRSYSKALCVPLIKYTKNRSPLIISFLDVNSIELTIRYNCFICDENGSNSENNITIEAKIETDFREITSNQFVHKIKELLENILSVLPLNPMVNNMEAFQPQVE